MDIELASESQIYPQLIFCKKMDYQLAKEFQTSSSSSFEFEFNQSIKFICSNI